MPNLIRICCNCNRIFGKQPLPDDYGKGLPDSIKGKDVKTHMVCDKCGPKLYGKSWGKK